MLYTVLVGGHFSLLTAQIEAPEKNEGSRFWCYVELEEETPNFDPWKHNHTFLVGILDIRNNLYEADIVLSDEEKKQVDQREEGDADGPGAAEDLIKRNAVRNRQKLWKSRVVPYRISPALCMFHNKLTTNLS